MTGGITVTGLAEVQAMLRDAPKTIVATGYAKALSAAANVYADEVEKRCPVKSEDTGGILDRGVLRESIAVSVEIDSQFRGGRAQVGFGKNGVVANLVEYGHRLIGHKPGKKALGMIPARPFMRPAFDVSTEKAIDAFAESLKETVREQFPGK